MTIAPIRAGALPPRARHQQTGTGAGDASCADGGLMEPTFNDMATHPDDLQTEERKGRFLVIQDVGFGPVRVVADFELEADRKLFMNALNVALMQLPPMPEGLKPPFTIYSYKLSGVFAGSATTHEHWIIDAETIRVSKVVQGSSAVPDSLNWICAALNAAGRK